MPVLTLFGLMIMLCVLALAALGAGYVVLRRRYVDEVARRAARAERERLAEDLHDLIGHDLALIAVQAGALEVHHPGEVATDAARIRSATQRATESLRELTGVLGVRDYARDDARDDARTDPAGRSIEDLVADALRAGIRAEAELAPLTGSSDAVRVTLARIVREALTNAVRHAPGAPVTIRLTRTGDDLRLEVANPLTGPSTRTGPGTGLGTGLGALRRRVELLGGELVAGPVAGAFVVRVGLPARTRPVAAHPARRPPNPALQLARRSWPYLATGAVVVLGFYSWATAGCTLEAGPASTLRAGQPAAVALATMPSRQAPVRLYRAPAEPSGSRCRYYTDGNFPFGLATGRVCFADGVVVAVQDLRGNLQ